MRSLVEGFLPNRSITLAARLGFGAVTLALVLLVWQLAPAALPRPLEIGAALRDLWCEQQLFDHLLTSFTLNAEAIAWSTTVTLALAYLTVLPALRPLVAALSKLRFTGLVGWGFVLTLLAHDGHQLKLWM